MGYLNGTPSPNFMKSHFTSSTWTNHDVRLNIKLSLFSCPIYPDHFSSLLTLCCVEFKTGFYKKVSLNPQSFNLSKLYLEVLLQRIKPQHTS